MDANKVMVSRQQFTETAVSTLVARGVRDDIARVFVTVGLEKEGSINSLKDVVCKAQFHSFFVHNPNVGVYVPTVVQLKMNKFYAPFFMTGREKAEFVGTFPELDVVCNGRTRNMHAFYANKRLAESEVLIMHVWAHAAKTGGLNPKSIIDLGGNETAHVARGRDYVHCDTPVLSARDAARYTLREVYSGSDSSLRCKHTFRNCPKSADFAIAVHSTYDLTPASIAHSMEKRGIKCFFGVLNLYPQLKTATAGKFSHDGINITVSGSLVHYSFPGDTSLSYSHSREALESYLPSQYSIKGTAPGSYYHFKHLSVRGATVCFSIVEKSSPLSMGTSLSTGGRFDKYTISISDVFKDTVEVDQELFDRLVLMAASSKNLDDYNITALFKYCKSLRVRVSINSIVLSSGFQDDTETMVKITVAAMAVAAAYHRESSRFFSKAVSQINSRRSKSVVSNLVTIASSHVTSAVLTIAGATGLSSRYSSLVDTWLNKIKSLSSVNVRVATVKEFGNRFDPEVLGSADVQLGKPDYNSWFTSDVLGQGMSPVDTTVLDAVVSPEFTFNAAYGVESPAWVFSSYGVSPTYPGDMVIKELHPDVASPLRVSTIPSTRSSPGTDGYLSECTSLLVGSLNLRLSTDSRPRTLPNGDRVVHVLDTSGDDSSGSVLQHKFIVIRGAGGTFVRCVPPPFYSRSKCLYFFLMVSDDITGYVAASLSGRSVETLFNPLYSVVRAVAMDVMHFGQETGTVRHEGLGIVTRTGALQGHGPVGARDIRFENMVDYENSKFTDLLSDLDSSDCGSDLSSTPSFTLPLPPRVSLPSVTRPQLTSFSDPPVRSIRFTNAPDSNGGAHATSDPGMVAGFEQPLEHTSVQPTRTSTSAAGTDSARSSPSSSGVGEFRKLVTSDLPRRKNWGSISSTEEPSPGSDALGELLEWSRSVQSAALSMGKRNVAFAAALRDGVMSDRNWAGIVSGIEGDIKLCKVQDGDMVDMYSGEVVKHMAYTDGESICVRSEALDIGGVWVTYRDLEVYTCRAIDTRVSTVRYDAYSCPVVLVKGPAGCGKTTKIVKAMQECDFGVCETRAAASDTNARLEASRPGMGLRFSTVDSFFINGSVEPGTVDTLYVDEALRLHAGKIWALVKLIRPKSVICFGDDKQIPVLPFTPGFDFNYHVFPWSSVRLIQETWRLPADIVMVLIKSGYYDYSFKTHNSISTSIKPVKQFVPGVFRDKPPSTVVLTYTQSAKDDLLRDGVTPVMTIGESQGKDLDDVWLFRDRPLGVQLYYDRNQTLTAITRVKRSFTFVTVMHEDDSAVAQDLLALLSDPIASASIRDFIF